MLKSFQIGRYVDSGDFRKLTEFLETIGFVRAPGKDELFGFQTARYSAPGGSIWIGALSPECPPGIAGHLRKASMMVGLETSDPELIFETARRMGFRVLLLDSAIEWSGDESFTVELPGGIIVTVSRKQSGQVSGFQGKLDATGKRFGVVVGRFNSFITERLLDSALDGLLRSGANRAEIAVVRVPGAFEIPSAARTLAETERYDAIICIGCLLRGDTAHYDVIVNEVTRGIGQSAQETGVPHAFGVLTCDTLEQAIDRAGLKMGNKGFEAALAGVEMANLKKAVLCSQFPVPSNDNTSRSAKAKASPTTSGMKSKSGSNIRNKSRR